MRVNQEGDRLVIRLHLLEAVFVLQGILDLIKAYETRPEDLDPRVASVWYSTRGCRAAGMSEEETREWIENLFGFKSATLEHLKKWRDELKRPKGAYRMLSLTREEAACLVTVLNDYRLMLAAQHGIGQEEMEQPVDDDTPDYDERGEVVFRIHVLGVLMEMVLEFVSPEAAHWMDLPDGSRIDPGPSGPSLSPGSPPPEL